MPEADLWAYLALSPSALELGDQSVGVLVQSEDVPVYVDPRALCPSIGIGVDSGLGEECLDVLLWDLLRDVDHLCGVLDKSAVLALGRLVGAQPTPLCGVKVSCLEVWLAPDERAGDPPHVGECGQVGGSVEQLAHAGPSAYPVACRECVHDLGGEHVWPEACVDPELSLPVVVPLELVLQVACELLQADSEEILDEVACEPYALVGVVVLVVRVLVLDGHLEDLSDDSSEEYRLLVAVLGCLAEVREELLVQ